MQMTVVSGTSVVYIYAYGAKEEKLNEYVGSREIYAQCQYSHQKALIQNKHVLGGD